jgi:hypothetical protein
MPMRSCPAGGRGKSCLGRDKLHSDTTRYDTEYLRQAASAFLFLGDEISVPRWAASKCTLSDFDDFVTPETLRLLRA